MNRKEQEWFVDVSMLLDFRFSGSEFPPEIFFKIYAHSDCTQIKYITGKKIITAGTEVSIALSAFVQSLFEAELI